MDKFDELFRQNPNLERLMRPDAQELEGLADSIQILRCQREDDPENPEINFSLAASLISHSRKSYVEEGLRLMEALVYQRWQANWSEVVGRHSLLPQAQDAPTIAKGVAVSRATAPPPSDDDEDEESVVEVSEETSSDAPEVDGPAASASPATVAATDGSEPTGSADPSSKQSKGSSVDQDVSSIRPGRIDDLALYHYYLTLGWIKLNDLEKAKSCVGQMLLLAPENKQGKALRTYIEVAERQGTAVDAATVAGISVVIAGIATVAGALLRSKQNSS